VVEFSAVISGLWLRDFECQRRDREPGRDVAMLGFTAAYEDTARGAVNLLAPSVPRTVARAVTPAGLKESPAGWGRSFRSKRRPSPDGRRCSVYRTGRPTCTSTTAPRVPSSLLARSAWSGETGLYGDVVTTDAYSSPAQRRRGHLRWCWRPDAYLRLCPLTLHHHPEGNPNAPLDPANGNRHAIASGNPINNIDATG